MKYYIINVFLLMVLVFSCHKEEFPYGYGTAKFNGEVWQAAGSFSSLSEDRLGVSFEVFENGYLRESIWGKFIPKKIGNYSADFISSDSLISSSYITVVFDGDAISDVYKLDKDKESNFISINKLTETVIEGEFDLTFNIDVRLDPNAPAVIHFSDGKFHLKLKE